MRPALDAQPHPDRARGEEDEQRRGEGSRLPAGREEGEEHAEAERGPGREVFAEHAAPSAGRAKALALPPSGPTVVRRAPSFRAAWQTLKQARARWAPMLRRCPECGGPLVARTPSAPREEPEFDERLAVTTVEDSARARSEGIDYSHAAKDLVCASCGAVVPWVEKNPKSA
jgi:endogenous inhibitor of DNA gyrase (YacG/DUF329 family)